MNNLVIFLITQLYQNIRHELERRILIKFLIENGFVEVCIFRFAKMKNIIARLIADTRSEFFTFAFSGIAVCRRTRFSHS